MPLYCSHNDEFGECRFHLFERDFKWGEKKPARCQHGAIEVECKYCLTEGAWAILKGSRDLRKHGHHRAIDWARGYLQLDDAGKPPQAAPDEDASWSAVNMDMDE